MRHTVRARFAAALTLSALLVSGCSSTNVPSVISEDPPNESVPAPVLSEGEIDALIRSVPEDKTYEGLRNHFKKIDEGASQLEPIEIEYTVGPTAVQSKVDTVVSRFQEKLKMYQLLGLESLNQDWVLASEKDYQWWVDYRLELEPTFPVEMWDNKKNVLGHCGLSSSVFCGAGNTVKGKNYQDNVVGTGFIDRGLDYVSRHEAAHFYQAVFGYGGRCWMAEGQATFFETYLETSSRSRTEVVAKIKSSPSQVTELGKKDLLELIETDQVCNGDSDLAYNLGMLGYEFLYQNFSFLQVHDLQVLSSTKSWDKAVTEVLLMEPKVLTQDLAKYIYDETR